MVEKETYDAIIIGAGHNGMALFVYLGKSGWKVLVPGTHHLKPFT